MKDPDSGVRLATIRLASRTGSARLMADLVWLGTQDPIATVREVAAAATESLSASDRRVVLDVLDHDPVEGARRIAHAMRNLVKLESLVDPVLRRQFNW